MTPSPARSRCLVILGSLMFLVAACGSTASPETVTEVVPTSTPAPTAAPAPTATSAPLPTATAVPEPTVTSTPTPVPTSPAVEDTETADTGADAAATAADVEGLPVGFAPVSPLTATTEVLDTGGEPRQLLAVSLEQGSTFTMNQVINIEIAQEINDIPQPDVSSRVESETEVEVAAGPGDTFIVRSLLGEQLITLPDTDPFPDRSIAGYSFEVLSRSDGRPIAFRSDLPPQFVEQFLAPVLDASNVPPVDVAIGVGGSWVTTNTFTSSGIEIAQSSTFTVTDMTEDTYTTDVVITQDLGPGGMDLPGLGPVDGSFVGSGVSTVVFSLSTGQPISLISSATNTSEIDTGLNQVVVTDTAIDIELSLLEEAR